MIRRPPGGWLPAALILLLILVAVHGIYRKNLETSRAGGRLRPYHQAFKVYLISPFYYNIFDILSLEGISDSLGRYTK